MGTQLPIREWCLEALWKLSESQEEHTASTASHPGDAQSNQPGELEGEPGHNSVTVDVGKHEAVKSLFLFLLRILICLALCQVVCW